MLKDLQCIFSWKRLWHENFLFTFRKRGYKFWYHLSLILFSSTYYIIINVHRYSTHLLSCCINWSIMNWTIQFQNNCVKSTWLSWIDGKDWSNIWKKESRNLRTYCRFPSNVGRNNCNEECLPACWCWQMQGAIRCTDSEMWNVFLI